MIFGIVVYSLDWIARQDLKSIHSKLKRESVVGVYLLLMEKNISNNYGELKYSFFIILHIGLTM